MPNQMARRPPSRHRRQQVLVLVDVELGRLGAEEDAVAERLAADFPLGQVGEDFFDRLAVVEEVVVGAEEGIDAGALGEDFHFVAQTLAGS